MQELKLPKRGQAMEEGLIVEWTVDVGEPIAAGEPIVLFETDKATEEIVAEGDGLLLAKRVPAGETVPIGTTLGFVGTEDERDVVPDSGSEGARTGGSTAPEASAESNESGNGADGPPIRGSPSARRAAREHDVSIEAVGRELGVRQVRDEHVERYASGGGSSGADADGAQTDGADAGGEEIRGSPAARRIAAEADVEITAVGEALGMTRVRMDDVEAYVDRHETEPVDDGELTPSTAAEPSGSSGPSVHETILATGTRGVMYDRMRKVATEYASTTTVARVDVTELMALIDSLADPWETHHGVSPSLTAFVVRAVAESLPDYRMLNAEIVEPDADEPPAVRQFADVNVGIAVDTDQGLLVPTVHGADGLSVRELGAEIGRLAEAARNRELGAEGMQGGTFTVSNAGTFGAYINTPRINPPQTGILGMCTVTEEAGVVDGEVVPRQFVHLCLTYDHRVVEGATAVQFLQTVKSRLKQPESLLS